MIIKAFILIFSLLGLVTSCDSGDETDLSGNEPIEVVDPDEDAGENPDNSEDDLFANINFSNWKVTLPVDEDGDDKPDEYKPDVLENDGYRTLEPIQDYMYDDTSDGSIVFSTFYGGITTPNSAYPRTELRELIDPTNSRVNWTLVGGGTLNATLKVDDVSDNTSSSSLDKDRFIVAQIHGIVNEDDVDTYNLDSNHAPPLLKMQWRDGDLYAYKKTLIDETTSGADLYDDSDATWTDISYNFGNVGYKQFDLEIEASEGQLKVTVNDETHIFDDISVVKWKFENYFKAGAYLQSTNSDSFCKVKFYSLEVTH